jgi:hypothetical protein
MSRFMGFGDNAQRWLSVAGAIMVMAAPACSEGALDAETADEQTLRADQPPGAPGAVSLV